MEKRIKIHYITGLVTAALVLLLGLSLAISAAVIYFGGTEQPYSRETVGEYLKYVLPFGILCILAVISGIVIKFVFPLEKSKLLPQSDEFRALKRQRARLEKKNAEALSDERILKESLYRKKISIALLAVLSILGIAALLVALLGNYDAALINESVIRVALTVFAVALIGGASAYVAKIYMAASARREAEIIKELLNSCESLESSSAAEEKVDRKPLYMNIARASIFALAIVFIVIGIFNGGMADVLGKAVRICTECIGLG